MVSVCQPSDAFLEHLPSYLGFSYLGLGVSLHACSSKAQPLLLTLDESHLLIATLPDLQCGMAPLGPPVPVQPQLPGCGVAPPGLRPWPRTRGGSFRHFLCRHSLALLGTAPDLGRGVTLLGHRPSGMGSSQLLLLTLDMGWLLAVILSLPVTAACTLEIPR